jgi:hypothetical protein
MEPTFVFRPGLDHQRESGRSRREAMSKRIAGVDVQGDTAGDVLDWTSTEGAVSHLSNHN